MNQTKRNNLVHLIVVETLCKWHIRGADGTKWEHFAMTT